MTKIEANLPAHKVPGSPALTLVLMAGMPGTGKTSLALALGQTFGWPVIDKDSLKSPLLTGGVDPALAGPASYTLMLELAHDLLVKQRLSVILDSPGRFPAVLERVQEMTEQTGAHLKIIQCTAGRELRHQRLTSRVARPSQWAGDAGLTDEQEQAMFAHFPANILLLDTNHPFEQCLARALAYLHSQEELTKSEGAQMNNFPINKQLAGVMLFNDAGHLLLQYRDTHAPTSPNQWSIPGGSIEPGETAEEAVRREALEETGLHLPEPLTLFWHGILPSISQPGTYNEWSVFLAHTHAQQADVIVGEGEAMVFLPLSQVTHLDLTPDTTYLLSLWRALQEKFTS